MQQDQNAQQPQARVYTVVIWIDNEGQPRAEDQTIYGGDSVEWDFKAEEKDAVEISFHEMTTPTGGKHRGPFPPKNDEHNPAEGVFKHAGNGKVLTLPARPPAHGFREERWKYDLKLSLASGETAMVDPLIIVRAR